MYGVITNVILLKEFMSSSSSISWKLKLPTPNIMVYGETGSIPLSVKIKTCMIHFWIRIVTGKSDKLITMMYNSLLTLYKSEQICISMANIYKTYSW